MNYRHSYHAGNFADVVKHVSLTTLITSLEHKPTPFCYIDTHSGPGYYDLFSEHAQKKKEYLLGIEKVIQADNYPVLVQKFLDCVHRINNELTGTQFTSLRYYPGSPLIARYLLHPHDRIIACELQPDEYKSLKATFAGDKQVSTHHMDGFLGLKAFLPPHERRGLILIDPPYENPDELIHIAHYLTISLKRFASGVYAIWFPIKEYAPIKRFYHSLQTVVSRPMMATEFTIYPELPNHLNGCGLVIINPPYQFTLMINDFLPWLWKTLSVNQQGYYRTHILKN